MHFLSCRARVKAGMRILGATATSDEWNVSVEKENPKHTVARVTAFRKDQDPDSTSSSTTEDKNSDKWVDWARGRLPDLKIVQFQGCGSLLMAAGSGQRYQRALGWGSNRLVGQLRSRRSKSERHLNRKHTARRNQKEIGSQTGNPKRWHSICLAHLKGKIYFHWLNFLMLLIFCKGFTLISLLFLYFTHRTGN